MTSTGIMSAPAADSPSFNSSGDQIQLLLDEDLDSGLDEENEEPVYLSVETSAVRLVAKQGAVYTRPWVVSLILDLAGYTPDRDLAQYAAVEPAVGSGAFLVEMARRLTQSCKHHGRPLTDASNALLAFDIDPMAVKSTREAIVSTLTELAEPTKSPELGVSPAQVVALAKKWVRVGDYLRAAPSLPPADFTVGNPPYVRLEDMEPASMACYRRDYPTMIGRADLYVAFYEAALRSLKPGGVCAFICADRWMRNQYGAGLRRFITSGSFHVETVLEMHDAKAFEEEVSAYPAITVIRRHALVTLPVVPAVSTPTVVARLEAGARRDRPNRDETRALLSHLKGNVPALPESADPTALSVAHIPSWFSGDEPWPQVTPEKLALLRRLEAQFAPLEDVATGTKVGIGVATGLDRVFLTDDPSLVEPQCLLPLAMAKDVNPRKATLSWSGHYLVDPWQVQTSDDLTRFPRLLAYLSKHETALRARHIARNNPSRWFRTIDRVDHSLTAKRKLYLPDIKGRITPVLDEGKTYPHHNLYVITSDTWDMKVLGGLLLSDIAQFFVECYAVRMRGGYLRFQAQYLRRIRVPEQDALSPELRQELAIAFRSRDVARATAAAHTAYGLEDSKAESYHPSV